jgi:hypothetical protein
VFWVISVYFNIRNTLPKSGTFLLGHSVYITALILNMGARWIKAVSITPLYPFNSRQGGPPNAVCYGLKKRKTRCS